MAVDVTTGRGKTTTEIRITGKTKVRSVRVGRPINQIDPVTGSIFNISGVDTTQKEDGSVLVYNATSENFEATKTLQKQFINGGNF
jgi:hypothetical protein